MPKKSSSKAKPKKVDTNNNEQDLQPVAEKTTVFVTSDGLGHYDKQYAIDHSRRLNDETIATTTDDVFEGTITAQILRPQEDGIQAFAKAEDLKVPSAAMKLHDK